MNSFTAFKDACCTYGLRHGTELVFCMQGNAVGRCLNLCNMCFKTGNGIADALSETVRYASKHYDSVQIVVDRRLWPRSILDGISCSKRSYTKPHRHFCVGKLKDGLVDELSEDDASSLHYTIHDSGDIIADVIA